MGGAPAPPVRHRGIGVSALLRGMGLGAALLGSCLNAWADPLTELLGRHGGELCYDRVYDQTHLARNPKQRTRAIRVALTADPGGGGAIIRVAISEASARHYVLGECYWAYRANLDIMDKALLPSFGRKAGLNCHAITTIDGASAEEGGDFPVDLRDGAVIMLHLPDEIAGWTSLDDVAGAADFFKLGPDDRVFRLERVEASRCSELREKLPWLL